MENKKSEIVVIEIMKSGEPGYWYAMSIGALFFAVEDSDPEQYLIVDRSGNSSIRCVFKKDVRVLDGYGILRNDKPPGRMRHPAGV